MQVGAKLSPEGFRNVHNALCELNQIHRKLKPLGSSIADDLERAIQAIRTEFDEAYAEDSLVFDTRSRQFMDWGHDNNIQTSVWSLYEVEDLDQESPLLASGKYQKLVYRSHWGDRMITTALTPDHKTWGHLWILSEILIDKSGDRHHIFVESFHEEEVDGEIVLALSTGS